MSLLGRQVYANPATPLWGSGGGGGGSNAVFESVSFTLPGSPAPIGSQTIKMSSQPYNSEYELGVFDPSGNLGRLQIGNILEVQEPSTAGGTDPAVSRMLYSFDGIDYQQAGSGTSVEFLAVSAGSNSFELSNVTAINGVPYLDSPVTTYSYQDYPGGADLSTNPLWGPLNSVTFTPTVNGKLFAQSHGTFVSQALGGAALMTFEVNGSNIADAPSTVNAFNSNTNIFNTVFTSIPVLANVPITIKSVAQRSAIPPEPDTDMVVVSSRMFLSLSTQ